jgi:hypothetical protein
LLSGKEENMRRSHRTLTAVVIAAVAAVACTSPGVDLAPDSGDSVQGDDAGAPLRPLPIVRLSLADLSTNVGDAAIRASIADDRPTDTAALERLGARLSLRTWPELEEVRCAVVITERGAGLPEDPRASVELRPVSPLEARWYVFRVEGLPADFSWPLYPEAQPLVDGALGSRFRPDSFPLLASLSVYSAVGLRTTIQLHFSERVAADVPAADLVEVRNGSTVPADCTVVEPPEVAVNCVGGLDLDVPIEVLVAGGFRSDGGAPVRTLGSDGPWSFLLDWATLSECGIDCRVFRPE